MADAVPDPYQHDRQRQGEDPHLPFGKGVIFHAGVECFLVTRIGRGNIIPQGGAQRVLL
ncbi:hypothetical protein D3C76_1643630 [compost metagenome]